MKFNSYLRYMEAGAMRGVRTKRLQFLFGDLHEQPGTMALRRATRLDRAHFRRGHPGEQVLAAPVARRVNLVEDLVPGGLMHLDTRVPHAVRALEPSKLVLTMLDSRKA